jgi:hypothetical protein
MSSANILGGVSTAAASFSTVEAKEMAKHLSVVGSGLRILERPDRAILFLGLRHVKLFVYAVSSGTDGP